MGCRSQGGQFKPRLPGGILEGFLEGERCERGLEEWREDKDIRVWGMGRRNGLQRLGMNEESGGGFERGKDEGKEGSPVTEVLVN